MKKLWLLGTLAVPFMFNFIFLYAQNFYAIGSADAPIKYVRGTGSNVGLIVGVGIPQNNAKLGKGYGSIGRGRFNRMQILPSGGGQGAGKRMALPTLSLPPDWSYRLQFAKNKGGLSVLSFENRNGAQWLFQDDPTVFEIFPDYEFEVTTGGLNEIFLPVLCLDQNLKVNSDQQNSDFELQELTADMRKVYSGFYRHDKYFNQIIVSKLFYQDGFFAWYEGDVSHAEAIMAIFCAIDSISGSQYSEPVGYYELSYGHILPIFAQWMIWAMHEKQDENSFLTGYNYISAQSGFAPSTLNDIADLLYLNHVVFKLAGMPDLAARFRAPDGIEAINPFNLEPRARILYRFAKDSNIANFDASYSHDPDGKIISRRWRYAGFDTNAISFDLAFDFDRSGETPIYLSVLDDSGGVAVDTVVVPYPLLITDVAELRQPQQVELLQNYPNPVGAKTQIRFTLPATQFVEIAVFNILGQKIRTLAGADFTKGLHKIYWQGRDDRGARLPAGIYFLRLQSAGKIWQRKMILLVQQ